MPKFIDLEQNMPEWKEWRRGKIGASMVPAIMGVSPYQTKLQLYNEMVGIQPKKQLNMSMKRGHDLEPVARDWCKAVLHLDDLEPAVAQHNDFDWAIASLDGYSPFHGIIVEIKCPNKVDHALALQGDIPDHYYPQLQHQMFVTDKEAVTYVSFDGICGTVVICNRDEEYIEKMILEEIAFLKCIQLGIPPDASDSDEVVIQDPLLINLGEQYQFLTEEIDSMTREREKIKNLITERCLHPKNSLGSLKVCKMHRKGNIDYKSVPEIKEMNLEAYRKPGTEYWEISK